MENLSWQKQIKLIDRQRWLILLPLALAFLTVYFHRVATGVVSDNLMSEFNIHRAADLGLLSSIYFYTYASLQLPAGILADKFGPRRVITVATAVSAIGAFLFGWAPTIEWLYGGRFIVSLGVGVIYVNIVKIYAEWFRTGEFGTMCGFAGLVGNAGAMLAATPLAFMVEFIGWRSSFYAIGAFSLIMSVGCCLIVRNKPGDYGWISIREVESHEGVALDNKKEESVSTVSAWKSIKTVLSNKYTWPPFLAAVGIYGAFISFSGLWGVPYLMQIYGMSRIDAANHVLVSSFGFMAIAPVVGFISDKIRLRRLPYTVCASFLLISWAGLTFWHSGKPPEWALYPLCFLMGAGVAATTLPVPCAREVNLPSMTGVAVGIANAGGFAGAALVQPLFGWILDMGWQGTIENGVKIYPQEAFWLAFVFCTLIAAVSVGLTLMIKETHCLNVAQETVFDKNSCRG